MITTEHVQRIRQKRGDSPSQVRKAIAMMQASVDAQKENTQAVVDLIHHLVEFNKEGLSEDALVKAIEDILQQEMKAFGELAETLKPMTPRIDVAWGLKTHQMLKNGVEKLPGVLEGALADVKDKRIKFFDVLKGQMLKATETHFSTPRILGQNNSELTYFNAAALTCVFALASHEKNQVVIGDLSWKLGVQKEAVEDRSLEWVYASDSSPLVKAPDVFIDKRFSDACEKGLTGAGHTGLVLGVENSTVVTLACNRQMPNIEGFGVDTGPISENQDQGTQQTYFWRSNLNESKEH